MLNKEEIERKIIEKNMRDTDFAITLGKTTESIISVLCDEINKEITK